MKIFVIGDKHTVAFFSLLGIEGMEISDPNIDIIDLVKRISTEKNINIFIVGDCLVKEQKERLLELKTDRFSKILVIELPCVNMEGTEELREYFRDYIKKVIGVKL